jgi:hypothetical protein
MFGSVLNDLMLLLFTQLRAVACDELMFIIRGARAPADSRLYSVPQGLHRGVEGVGFPGAIREIFIISDLRTGPSPLRGDTGQEVIDMVAKSKGDEVNVVPLPWTQL